MGRRKKESKLLSSVECDNITITDPTEIACAFNNYFSNIGSNVSANIEDNIDNITYQSYLQNRSQLNCTFTTVTEPEVLCIINKMDNKSSSGYDAISNKILKYLKNELCNGITLIVNQMLETGIFPSGLKLSKIIPLYKKGDKNLLSNYRPISLLPTMSKIFERVIYNQLYSYFTSNNLLSEQQYGFRAKHSTELAAIKLVDYIKTEIDNKYTPVNIYIDLSKAFDTINYDILLYKLDYYGVGGIPLQLIQNYLTNRKQYVKYNTHKSTLKMIDTGVPQGSILGPLLFSIYINDLVNVSNTFKYVMYADDTTIYFNLEEFSINN